MRSGLWISGAGGSGIIIGRLPDGSWSPPSGILLHTAGLGFLIGIDIYDCVVVINTQKAMDAFARLRCTIGGEISAVAGPFGAGGILDTELHKRQAPLFTYMKSRGFYAGVQVDGTIMVERNDENERYYMQKLSAQDILTGKVKHPPYECRYLNETLKAAQGDSDVDERLLPEGPPPGDYEVEASTSVFGVPDKEDPDPYGVLALEKEGMSLREAGTQKRASWEQFAFQPAPSSPIYSTYSRNSFDNKTTKTSARSSWLTHTTQENGNFTPATSTTSESRRPGTAGTMLSTATQTDDFPDEPRSNRSSARGSMLSAMQHNSMDGIPEDSVVATSPKHSSLSKTRSTSYSRSPPLVKVPEPEPSTSHENEDGETDTDDDAEDDVIIEEPVIHSISKAASPQFITKARMVQVPKREPPKLPPRNPNRQGPMIIGGDRASEDGGSVKSLEQHSGGLEAPPAMERAPSSNDIINSFEDVDIGSDRTPMETPGETPEERNPWGTIIAKHNDNASKESLQVPGAFHSLPTTPDERPTTPEEVALPEDA